MFPQRNVLRFSQRAAQQLRTTVQRRFNSTESKFPWAVDNEFNRERAAVKHHAAATSGVYNLNWLRICENKLYLCLYANSNVFLF